MSNCPASSTWPAGSAFDDVMFIIDGTPQDIDPNTLYVYNKDGHTHHVVDPIGKPISVTPEDPSLSFGQPYKGIDYWEKPMEGYTLIELDFHVVLGQSGLMAWSETPYSYLSMTKESEYSEEQRLDVRSSRAAYLFLYPFWKKRDWYRLPAEERGRIMREHIETGRRYPSVSINTTYSFGLDDQEFVVAFETDQPSDFLDLVHELRAGESSSYTLRDTPIFSCISTSVQRALDALDGHAATAVRDLSAEPLNAEAIVSPSRQ